MSDFAIARGEAIKKFTDAVTPLYTSLTPDQKYRLASSRIQACASEWKCGVQVA